MASPNAAVLFETLGCKLNQAETEAFREEFQRAGYRLVTTPQEADVYVLNTCTVTHVADRKARQLLRRAHLNNPRALIVAVGCYPERAPQEVARMKGVQVVVRNREKGRLRHLVETALSQRDGPAPSPAVGDHSYQGRTRAFVKIQEGCDSSCAFCIVPRVRGREKSMPLAALLATLQAKAEAGYQEVVLTGTQLGAYRDGGGATLSSLVKAILRETRIPRLRISSLQPQDLDEDFLRLWQNPRLCRHLHMPLQSGAAEVLARMRRRYTPEEYRMTVDRARELIPQVAITTDVIVGFPGETAEDFATTHRFCQELAFAGIHVFPYSRRPGTAAARMPHGVDEAEKGERVRALLALAQESAAHFRRRFVGQRALVLWETQKPLAFPQRESAEGADTAWSGLTDNYLRVLSTAPEIRPGTCTMVRLAAEAEDALWGMPVGA